MKKFVLCLGVIGSLEAYAADREGFVDFTVSAMTNVLKGQTVRDIESQCENVANEEVFAFDIPAPNRIVIECSDGSEYESEKIIFKKREKKKHIVKI